MCIKETVRSITTLGDKYPIYKDAEVEIRDFDPSEVHPTSLYVLNDKLDRLRGLRAELLEDGIDIFKLDDILEVNGRAIAPPVIEYDGTNNCIVDGLHRFVLAGDEGRWVRSIFVNRGDISRPIIGQPVDWHEVVFRDDLPTDPKERRRLREGILDTSENLRMNYRDLTVLGSNGRRPSGRQTR